MGRGRRWARAACSVVVTAGVGGCVGATDRADFEAEVESRGGGFSEDLVAEVVAGIADEVGSDDFAITHLTVSPLTQVVSAQVRDPRAPGQLDDYVFRGGDLVDVSPVRVSDGTDLDDTTVPIDDYAIDGLDEVVDAALEAFEVSDGYATTVRLGVTPAGAAGGEPEPTVAVDVESPRAAATVRFTADGDLVAVDRR